MERADETKDLLGHVLVPVANPKDAERTATELKPYNPAKVTVVHVVEKGEGVPDKTPVEHSKSVAQEAYSTFKMAFPDAETHTDYGRDVVDTITNVASDIDATAIVFASRGGNRIVQFLAGDLTLKLVTEADRPVIGLPVDEN